MSEYLEDVIVLAIFNVLSYMNQFPNVFITLVRFVLFSPLIFTPIVLWILFFKKCFKWNWPLSGLAGFCSSILVFPIFRGANSTDWKYLVWGLAYYTAYLLTPIILLKKGYQWKKG